jgi:ERCC4-type nuclease
MIIKIDNREHELLKKIEYLIQNTEIYKEIQMVVEVLPLGDFIINDGVNDLIIIERKTLNDLSASIKDGRYEEQSYRLNGIDHPNHNITYLIEGNISGTNSKLIKQRNEKDKTMLYSAMCSICYFKGFTVMRSFDMSESAAIICNMTYKLMKTKDRSLYYTARVNNNENTINENTINENTINENIIDSPERDPSTINVNENTSKDYCSVVKKVKKDNITTDNIGEIMLCQIPGISFQTARAVLDKFKNLKDLIKSIEEDKNCLNDIHTTDNKKKTRKLSKKSIENIIHFLLVS